MIKNNFSVIPAIDIRNGKCVRLSQGDYNKEKIYADDPVLMAQHWTSAGARRIHIVDLDGAREGKPVNLFIIEKIRQSVDCTLEIGGGIRSVLVVDRYLELGIDYVILGSIAFTEKDYFSELVRCFPEKIILGLDVRDNEVKISGWFESTGIKISEAITFYKDLPLAAIIVTDISCDGMLSGPNFALYESIIRDSNFPVIASGGISSNEHINRLRRDGAAGAIVGKALYEGADIDILSGE